MMRRLADVALACLVLPSLCSAALIEVPTTGTVEDFDSRVGCGYCFTIGPVVLPSGVVFRAGNAETNTGLGAVLGTGLYGLGENGSWNGPFFAGVDGPTNWMVFELPVAVPAVSALMNYEPGHGRSVLEALDAQSVVLESYDLVISAPIVTPYATNGGGWRGIVRATADITALRVSGSYTVVDDLTFGGDPAPLSASEPASLLLLGSGLLAAGLRRPRRRRQ